MPLITDEIMAACRTEAELAQEITRRYIKYQRNPQVDVFVKEYNSRPVAIMGAVNSPGRFQLQRRIRLLELLSFAGGPTAKAGRVVQITSSPKFIDCEVMTGEDPIPSTGETQEATTAVYNLRDALQGKEGANPYLRAGDIVKVPDAELVFVVGNVTTPSAIALNERITVTRAIAVAGGVLPNTKKSQVRILRDDPATQTKSEILVDLKAISKHQVPDPVLEAGDILEVPTVTGFQRALAGMLNGLMGLPITAIR
jgi:polysaccharide export outer membrane protein